ncbi:UDP-GlcNAc:undecaprenyl-phosphate GlcNAc-1-phosphate transferase [Vreelandella subglaciescola]|uniref:UDP-GlcNAc:undecaprenyl-phosphate GlcNAc-1-phosphate transferase n=2 Tax=Vreelandella subglaciescola TaxID=29571 RepID=A0A1M7HAK7_9GAMM|nr:UDP-GlcNAc:undecaprenyl-phosphate GlcNAc-1-phosphate transferase [Halomonas subglaciescola]
MTVTPFLPLLALCLSAVSILLLRQPAIGWGLADAPGGRKQHQGTVPLTGGLGVFIGFLLVQPLQPAGVGELLPLYVGVLALVVCGVLDDARDMRSTLKLGVQLAVAALMVLWGQRTLEYLGSFPLLGAVHLGWLAVPVTIVAVAGLINAINMMDGVDGLAGGSALSVLGWLAFVAALQSQLMLLAVIVTLAAALVGFLLFNLRHPWRRKASVFMGDSGSMALGFAIAWFVVELSQSPRAVLSPVAYLWVVALPVMDTLSLMVRRILKGRSPFSADRNHLHHIFLRAGFTAGQTSMILMLLVAALGGIGVVLSLVGVPDVLLLASLLVVFLMHGLFVTRAWHTSKALRRLHKATLDGGAVRASSQIVRLRSRPLVGGGRRQAALIGLYLMAFSVGLNTRLALAGGALVVAAAVLAYPLFWRDVLRLKLFWLSLGLSLYLLLRGVTSGNFEPLDNAPLWWGLLAISGLASLPLAWWLAQCRLHWNWLVLTAMLGGGFTFMLDADWSLLERGRFSIPGAWGEAAHIGFMSSVGLVVMLAVLLAGLQRLGAGWRPAAQVVLAAMLTMPIMIVLMGTGYTTAWLAAAAGGAVYVVASTVLGRPQGYRLGRLGVGALLAVLLLGVVSHDWLLPNASPLVQRLVEPLQAIGLVLNGQFDQAQALHPGIVERVTLWDQAWEAFQAHWLLGSGQLVPPAEAGALTGYRDYASLLASVATGLGLIGLLGFAAVVVVPLKALVWASLHRHWHAIWGLGILSCGVTVLVFCLLAMPLYYPGAVGFIVLLIAAIQIATFQRDWTRQRQ